MREFTVEFNQRVSHITSSCCVDCQSGWTNEHHSFILTSIRCLFKRRKDVNIICHKRWRCVNFRCILAQSIQKCVLVSRYETKEKLNEWMKLEQQQFLCRRNERQSKSLKFESFRETKSFSFLSTMTKGSIISWSTGLGKFLWTCVRFHWMKFNSKFEGSHRYRYYSLLLSLSLSFPPSLSSMFIQL